MSDPLELHITTYPLTIDLDGGTVFSVDESMELISARVENYGRITDTAAQGDLVLICRARDVK